MSEILRAGLLDDVRVLVSALGGAPDSRLTGGLVRLGAHLAKPGESGTRALVLDCSGTGGWRGRTAPGAGPLLDLLDGAWSAVLAAAVEGFIPAGLGGRIVFIASAADGFAAAALENLSRTLSVEWARHSVTAVTVVSGARTDREHLATIVAYLLSPAGAYFSGTRLELDSLAG